LVPTLGPPLEFPFYSAGNLPREWLMLLTICFRAYLKSPCV
jgi:hypothetical protein